MSIVATSLISTIKSDQPTGKNFSPVVVSGVHAPSKDI